MGQVVPFIARMRDSGDWSASERARLEALADRLAAGGIHVEVIFGATDEGDPWCVVTDESGDVLIHVARIDGRFVVHSAIDDAVNENVDLQSALRDRLETAELSAMAQSATILPFSIASRQGQTFLALLAATAFLYETAAVGDTAEAAPSRAAPDLTEDPTPPPPLAEAQAQERELTVQGAALAEVTDDRRTPIVVSAPAGAEPPAPLAQAEAATSGGDLDRLAAPPMTQAEIVGAPDLGADDAPLVVLGTAGDDLLVGTSADERLEGGQGNDTLLGGGGHDTLLGGAGDDRIELGATVVAQGGAGADAFVLTHTPHAGGGKVLLGVILDFFATEGDRLFTSLGREIRLTERRIEPGEAPPPASGPDNRLPQGGDDFTTQGREGPAGPKPLPLTEVDIDLDGDGVVDGYVLVGPRASILVQTEEQPITLPGASFNSGDLFG